MGSGISSTRSMVVAFSVCPRWGSRSTDSSSCFSIHSVFSQSSIRSRLTWRVWNRVVRRVSSSGLVEGGGGGDIGGWCGMDSGEV